jgi:hypothetical protein
MLHELPHELPHERVFDIVPLVYNDNMDTSAMTNVLLIDNTLQEYQQFVEGCNANTFPIVYDYHSDRNELKELLARKFSSIQRIAFVFHNAGMNGKLFLNNQCFFSGYESPFSENVQVLVDIIRDFGVGHVDYLACNSLEYDTWRQYYELLQTAATVVVGASDDATGNIQYGGDWVMETTNQDIKTIYFNDSIDEYTKTLATNTISASMMLTDASLNDSNLYTWPITIDGGTASSPVVITFGDNITLTNVNNYFIIGSDYVTIDGNNKTVTISGVTGVTKYPGLIQNGTVSANGYSNITVRNINITSNNSTLRDSYGWICQPYFCIGSSGINTISNCTNRGPISAYAGGIAGYAFAEASSGTNTITNCTNSGPVSVTNAGGITGSSFAKLSTGTNTITNCTNSGPVSVTNAGGIAGSFFASTSTGTNTITNCTNSGTVTNNAGGIAGGAFAAFSSGTNKIQNCYTISSVISYNIQSNFVINSFGDNGQWVTANALQYILKTDPSGNYIWAYAKKVNGDDDQTLPFLLYSLNPNNTRVGFIPTPTVITLSVPSPKTFGVDTSFTLQDLSSNSPADFSYNSSNTSVATISNGKVTIVGAGSTMITVRQDACGNYTDGSANVALSVQPTLTYSTTATRIFNDTFLYDIYRYFQHLDAGQSNCQGSQILQFKFNVASFTGTPDYSISMRDPNNHINQIYFVPFKPIQTGENVVLLNSATGSPVYLIPQIRLKSSDTVNMTSYTWGEPLNYSETLTYNTSNSYLLSDVFVYDNIRYFQHLDAGTSNCQGSQILQLKFIVTSITGNPTYTISMRDPNNHNNQYYFVPPKQIQIGENTVELNSENGSPVYLIPQIRLRNGDTVTITSYTWKQKSTITNFSILSKTYGNSPFTISDPSSNSSGNFTYTTSNTNVATISGKVVTITGAGNTTITVRQDACGNYANASIDASLVVSKATTTLSNFTIPSIINEHTTIQLNPPQSNNPSTAFTYTSSNTNVAIIVNNNQLKIIGNGTTTITATQLETNNYLPSSITTQFDTNVIKFPQATDIQPNKITGTAEPNSTVVVRETTINDQTLTSQTQSDAEGIWNFNVTTSSIRFSFAPLNATQFANTIQSDYNMKYPKSKYSLTLNTQVLIKPRQNGINELDQRSWRISPKLPSGLKFSGVTGIISGTPTVPAPSTTYTVWSNSEIFLGYRRQLTIEIVSP